MIELPPIINRRQFDNDQDFIEKAYETFIHDFVEYPPTFLNKKVACLPNKTTDGKYFNTFWHVITEGDHRESDRFVQERIERIPWIRPIIDEQPDKDWYVWDKPLKRKTIGSIYTAQNANTLLSWISEERIESCSGLHFQLTRIITVRRISC